MTYETGLYVASKQRDEIIATANAVVNAALLRARCAGVEPVWQDSYVVSYQSYDDGELSGSVAEIAFEYGLSDTAHGDICIADFFID